MRNCLYIPQKLLKSLLEYTAGGHQTSVILFMSYNHTYEFISTANEGRERTSGNRSFLVLTSGVRNNCSIKKDLRSKQEEPQLGENNIIACPITLTSRVRHKRDVLLWIPISQLIHGCWKATVKRAFPLSSSEI